MAFINASKVLVTDLMLHDSSVTGSNMVISCHLLSEIEFTAGFEACCMLLQRSKASYFQYTVTIQ